MATTTASRCRSSRSSRRPTTTDNHVAVAGHEMRTLLGEQRPHFIGGRASPDRLWPAALPPAACFPTSPLEGEVAAQRSGAAGGGLVIPRASPPTRNSKLFRPPPQGGR